MKTFKLIGLIFLAGMLAVSCQDIMKGDNGVVPIEPINPSLWFKEEYEKLIDRIGVISSDGYADITDIDGIDAAQVVNTQYICNAINAIKGTRFSPAAGTAAQVADCEYLLKMIDKTNSGLTSYGTGTYATKQIIDKTAVSSTLNLILMDKFVAVGRFGKIMCSTDGINWIETNSNLTNDLYGVAYGDKKFVATGSSGKIAYSADGITWIQTSTSNTDNLLNVIYGNGKFVATGMDRRIHYSSDGIKWSTVTLDFLASSTGFYDIAYGNSKFVITTNSASGSSSRIIYSADGINWAAATMTGNTSNIFGYNNIIYGSNNFVAVTSYYKNVFIAYSSDGINWTEQTKMTTDNTITNSGSAGYGADKYVVFGSSGVSTTEFYIYSTDGINWSSTATPLNTSVWNGICYNDRFVALGNNNKGAHSSDGISWTIVPIPVNSYDWDICFGGS